MMDRKTIFLELPSEVIDRIDNQNDTGDRSSFITGLLNRQLDQMVSTMDASTEIPNMMNQETKNEVIPGEIKITDSKGQNLGKFNINTVDGFDTLAQKICEISDDPIVRMKARRLR